MLKRRRSSPSFVPDSPYDATPESAKDVFERVAKRRRPFAHTRDQGNAQERGSWTVDDTDGEEDVEGDDDSPERSEQAARLQQAGDYRHVNSLLHDLHAEQRHRMLFSSTLPPSLLSTPQYFPAEQSRGAPQSTDKITPTLSNDGDTSSAPHASQKPMPTFTISIPCKEASVMDHVEVRHVEERYADMNRYLGSLFLSRRKSSDSPSQHNQT
ncbi:hypothetical protein PYCCODRAFT_1464693 [Trametes coccinea BRFM310]|uniref:Uncharacterized protein n=1 Tax=Trametes coccinea (strain BRFM310) TaxID=1353009 RepID=A0A1Y2J0N9_TRAC3|nr:hypothetical protein PYCCODRAFT_1464693 [Trametes coccinea BRFM310]